MEFFINLLMTMVPFIAMAFTSSVAARVVVHLTSKTIPGMLKDDAPVAVDVAKKGRIVRKIMDVFSVMILVLGLVIGLTSHANRATNEIHDHAAKNEEMQRQIMNRRVESAERGEWKPPKFTDDEREKRFEDSVDWRKNVEK